MLHFTYVHRVKELLCSHTFTHVHTLVLAGMVLRSSLTLWLNCPARTCHFHVALQGLDEELPVCFVSSGQVVGRVASGRDVFDVSDSGVA